VQDSEEHGRSLVGDGVGYVVTSGGVEVGGIAVRVAVSSNLTVSEAVGFIPASRDGPTGTGLQAANSQQESESPNLNACL